MSEAIHWFTDHKNPAPVCPTPGKKSAEGHFWLTCHANEVTCEVCAPLAIEYAAKQKAAQEELDTADLTRAQEEKAVKRETDREREVAYQAQRQRDKGFTVT